jgi:putative serine protease PepD
MTDAPPEPTPAPDHYSSATPPPPVNPAGSLAPAGSQDQPQPQPNPGQGGPDGAVPKPAPRRSAPVGVIVALVVGALVGGTSGAGVVLAVNGHAGISGTNAAPTSITVNNSSDVNTITAVAAKASPSIVTISVTAADTSGTGSGIVLSKDGYVLTNTHVVTLDGTNAAGTIQVQTNEGQLLSAKVIGTDPIDDLAVIKLNNVTDMQPAEWADSSKLNVGDMAIAIGAPLDLPGTVTNGIVSALNRSITVASSAVPDNSANNDSSPNTSSPYDLWNFDTPGQDTTPTTATSTIALSVIQTDAAINPGNSGGALLDSDGKVIGVNVAIASAGGTASTTSGSIGVGFAIPSNVAQRIAKDLMTTGKTTHGLLGAGVVDVTDDKTQTNPTTVGASITEITSGGAAAAAGLKVGDIITKFNGIPITNKTDLTAQVRVLAAGSSASLTYVRGGSAHTATVTLGTLK